MRACPGVGVRARLQHQPGACQKLSPCPTARLLLPSQPRQIGVVLLQLHAVQDWGLSSREAASFVAAHLHASRPARPLVGQLTSLHVCAATATSACAGAEVLAWLFRQPGQASVRQCYKSSA